MPISTGSDTDLSGELAERVHAASASGTPLRIVGGDTKRFYGRQVEGDILHVSPHRGVIDYQPSELVITARAGTPILEIEALLAGRDQMLAFEPPVFGDASTLGGVVAAGLAGARRPFTGAVRDFVLGATVLAGKGQSLRLGGTVFKNVAGFDGFRLMAGALGCLGVLLDVSIRVVPRHRAETFLAFDEPWPASRLRLAALLRRPTPISGACHDGERLRLRLSGPEGAVGALAARLGGEVTSGVFWDDLRGLRHPVLGAERLWRLSLPQGRDIGEVRGPHLIDWAGAQVWLAAETAPAPGGHATLFRGARGDETVFTPLTPPILALHRRLKAAVDPAGVFNPGRMYQGL